MAITQQSPFAVNLVIWWWWWIGLSKDDVITTPQAYYFGKKREKRACYLHEPQALARIDAPAGAFAFNNALGDRVPPSPKPLKLIERTP